MRRSHLTVRQLLGSMAVAVGMTAGSVLGAAPAHADTISLGDCSLTAKLTWDHHDHRKTNMLSVQGVGAVQCKTRKATITATIQLKRNGTVINENSGTWTNAASLGDAPIFTPAATSLRACASYQSRLWVSIPGLGEAGVTSGVPIYLCP